MKASMHFRPTAQAQYKRGRRTCVVSAATSAAPPTLKYKPIPQFRGSLPFIGILHRTSIDQMFLAVEHEFAETGARCLDFQLFGKHAYYTRHPDDIGNALKHATKWVKSPNSFKRLDRWLGHGLVSELDADKHAQARDMLAPAFKAQSVKDLVPLFVRTAQQLAHVLLSQAGKAVELEPLTRRATLDVIGTAGFGHDFKALELAAQQLQHSGGLNNNSIAEHKSMDVVREFDEILKTSMLLILDPPAPDFLVPGFGGYTSAIEKLEQVATEVLRERRQQGISPEDKSLLSFMLRAQQADPAGMVTDQHIRDQLMTFMLAGSDTSAVTLGLCLHQIANNPDVLARVQEELQQVLGDTPTAELRPEAYQTLPYLTGCINESLRLFPAAPGLLRIAKQDAVFGEHFIPKDSAVIMDIFSMHRHPDFWPRAWEWLPERWLPCNMKSLGQQHPDAFMPFSAGARSCIGRYFAMLEMQVVLAVLLRQLSFVPEPGHEEVKLTQSFTIKSRGGARAVPVARSTSR